MSVITLSLGKSEIILGKKKIKSGYFPRKFKLRFNGLSLLFNFSQIEYYIPVAFYLLFFFFSSPPSLYN